MDQRRHFHGTVMLKDIYPGAVGSSPTFFTDVNGTAFFIAKRRYAWL